MTLAVLILVSTQLLFSKAAPTQSPEPPLASIPCNDPGAEAAADLSLRELNADRREGFVLGLKRITNAQEQFQENVGSVYYLALDVLETQCHVLSRENWKDCQPKRPYEAVHGECKVIFHINKPMRIVHLYSYDCTLKPVTPPFIGCPGCPIARPLNDTKFQDIAKLGLEKFNNNSNSFKYFILEQITKGAVQVIAGAAYHVEFTIKESSCNKTSGDLTVCPPVSCKIAETGYCKSRGIAHWSAPNNPSVTITCNLFKAEDTVGEEQTHQNGHTDQHQHGKKGEKHDGHTHHEHNHKHGRKHDHKNGHKHHHDGHKDGHKHDHESSESHEHDHQHQHHECHRKGRTIGKITYLPSGEDSTAIPVTEGKEGTKPLNGAKPSLPDGQTHPSIARPGLIHIPKPYIRPFPKNPSTSDQCPGKDKYNEPLVDPVPAIPEVPAPIPK
ncbi:fetuin-B [Pelobates cultripes]|uniref:Fetuin-B n=1 Tax=Pelobates cultripes TaxID=61616 RepID=A0AAD1VU28_PELCU|nr:fetuin-B [Pelobates cultripes]